MTIESLINLLPNSSAAGSWQAFAVGVTLRVTFVLAASALVGAALRRASASLRHLVWGAALAGTLALPFLTISLPSWRVPILPQAKPAPRVDVRNSLTERFRAPIGSKTLPGAALGEAAVGERTIDPRQPAVTIASGVAATPFSAVDSSPQPASRHWGVWIAAVWGVGFVIVLMPLLAGHARLRTLGNRFAKSSDGRLVEVTERLCHDLGQPRRVVLLQGDDTTSPMTWGVLRPVILLPNGAETWHHERLRAVLLHELAHVKRFDCLTQMMARIVCAAYWFHPMVWLAANRLRVESERACDDLVLRSGSRASTYAADLLEVARTFDAPLGLMSPAVPMARTSQLERRLRAILDRSQNRREVTRRGATLLFGAVAVVLLPLSAVRIGARVSTAVAAERERERPAGPARMTVAGRVLDPDGRPILGAKVAIVGRRKLATLTARAEQQHEVMGRAESDAVGRFRLEVPRTSSVTHYEVQAVASGLGFGLGWAELNRDAEAPTTDVRLKVEQPIEGRVVDLQGAPAAGLKMRISGVGVVKAEVGGYDGLQFWNETPRGLDQVWPDPVVSDPEGRFRLSGIGRGAQVGLGVEDLRFARQSLSIETDAKEGSKTVTLAVQPAMRISGRVTCADTGFPLTDALITVGSGSNRYNLGGAEYRTDASGRYEANPPQGKYAKVTVYPPVGSPYLIFERNFEGDGGEARREVDMAVPRGVMLTGRVTERGSGRPLIGASVFYENGQGNVVEKDGTIPGWMSAVVSDSDGRYAIAVTPGKGYLVAYGPTADYVHEVRGHEEISRGKPGGRRRYAHAFLPYDVQKRNGPVEIDVGLKPGVTLAGRVEGPDGQAVDRAEIVTTLSISPFDTFWRGDFTIPVREGRFELHGVAPDRPANCSFLDARNGWGATVELTAAMATKGPLIVKLQPCGKATARLVDGASRPVAKQVLSLNIVGTPGVGTDYGGQSLTRDERAMLASDEEIYANVDRMNYWEGPRSDREGRITFPKLIPGATYRIYEYSGDGASGAYRWRDFTVEAGRTTDLGDVRIKAEGR